MRDPDAADREYDPQQYWRDPGVGARGLRVAYWADPWPELQGMLNAERIRAYHDAVGRMIRPFDSELLKPASYELTLGSDCLIEGEPQTLTEDDEFLTIPPNSLVFVSMQQVVCLPHYLIGRFDLAIKFIYQGLLLGTGPQVDPGFQGALSCPLHNISNQAITIKLGEAFAKIDFAKTVPRTDRIRADLEAVESEEALAEWSTNHQDEGLRFFKSHKASWRRPIYGYLTEGKRPTSSVAELKEDVDAKIKQFDVDLHDLDTRSTRRFNGSLAVGVATVLLAIPAFVFGTVSVATNQLATKADVVKLQDQISPGTASSKAAGTKTVSQNGSRAPTSQEIVVLNQKVCVLEKALHRRC